MPLHFIQTLERRKSPSYRQLAVCRCAGGCSRRGACSTRSGHRLNTSIVSAEGRGFGVIGSPRDQSPARTVSGPHIAGREGADPRRQHQPHFGNSLHGLFTGSNNPTSECERNQCVCVISRPPGKVYAYCRPLIYMTVQYLYYSPLLITLCLLNNDDDTK